MMKKFFKTASCFFAGLLLCSMSLASIGCDCGGDEDDPSVVTFSVWDSGWGIDAFQAFVDAFNEKDHDFTVEMEYSSDQVSISSSFESGYSESDVLLCPVRSTNSYQYLEPMDGVLDSTVEGESKTIREKIPQYYLDFMTQDDKVVMLPANQQFSGIVYNKDLFEEVGAEVPRTTDELIDLTDDSSFNNAQHRAFIHFADGYNGYYPYIMDVWTAQYNGYDNWKNLASLTPYGSYADEKAVLSAQDGRYYMLEALSRCVNYSKVHTSSNSSNFTTSQTAFLDGQAMMMVNGNWLGVEMMKNDGDFNGENFLMMKNPVLSAIINVVPDGSIADDAELCTIIDYIDEGKTFAQIDSPTFTENDYNRIVEARGMMTSGGNAAGIFVPNYSNTLDYAKEFVKFYFSDEAAKIWRDIKHTDHVCSFSDSTLESEYNYDAWSTWDKNNRALYKTIKYPIGNGFERNNLYIENGISIYMNVDCISPLTATNPSDRKTYAQLWQTMQDKINNSWSQWASQMD